MSISKIAIVVLIATASVASPCTYAKTTEAVELQLKGLSADEAAQVIASLQDAQQHLRSEEFQHFYLLGGSVASYEQANFGPRETFLAIPFDEAWNISRIEGGDSPLASYSLSYAPKGLGQNYWEIQASFDHGGKLERVILLFKPPAPF